MNYWIHISDAKVFRVAEWLCDYNWICDDRLVDRWHIDYYTDEIRTDDIVFIWNKGGPDKTGFICQGKVVPKPDKFLMAEHEPDYFVEKQALDNLTGLSCIAVKYIRLCLGNPLTKPELETDDTVRTILAKIEEEQRIIKIPEAVGKRVEWLMKGRTNLIDLTYCQT
jgi:hypothetical protein